MTYSERRNPTTSDMSLRRANLLASLDLERQRADARLRANPLDDVYRRLENLEGLVYKLARQFDDVEGVAQEQAEFGGHDDPEWSS